MGDGTDGCAALNAAWRDVLDGTLDARSAEFESIHRHAADCRPCARALGALIEAAGRPEARLRRGLPLALGLAVLAAASLLLNVWLLAHRG